MIMTESKYLGRSLGENNIKWSQVLLISILFLLVSPFMSLTYLIISFIKEKYFTKTNYYIFFACISLYLGSINATKHVTGDQYQYYVAYMNVPEVGFWKSLIYIYGADLARGYQRTNISGEFMNGVYNYIGYYMTFGYYPLFAALLTFVDYMFIFLGLYKFCNTLKKPHIPIVCGVLILSFFYLFFNYTLQIQKQFLAQSIMMFVLGSYAAKGKMTQKLWIITAIAVFTHASVALFLPFVFLKSLRRQQSKKGLVFMGILFFFLILLGPRLAGNITSSDTNSVLTYGASRLANSEVNNDVEFGIVWSQVLVIAIPLVIIVFKKLWLERKTLNATNAFILNIMLLLLLTIVAMFRQPLAQYRYFMMLFAFMPFVYPFISNDIKIRNSFLKSLSGIMIIWFYYQFERIVWHYAPEIDIIVKPPVMLIFGNYDII